MYQEIFTFIPNIFYQVLYMTVIGSIVGLIILSIRNIFDKKLSGKLRCFMWLIVLATLLIPIRFEITTEISNNKILNQMGKSPKNIAKNILYGYSLGVTD